MLQTRAAKHSPGGKPPQPMALGLLSAKQAVHTVPTTKSILFAAGDVGGARALIPVINEAVTRGHHATVLRNGYIAREAAPKWHWVSLSASNDIAEIDAALDDLTPDVVVFASSVKDYAALALARRAQARGLKLLHVLDSWSAYSSRMSTDGFPALSPDIYAVMDTLAADAAVADGVSRSSIRVTGQPDLSSRVLAYSSDKKQRIKDIGQSKQILFVSEPAAADHGSSAESKLYRGYTEADVVQLLCEALQSSKDQFYLSVLPHPREDAVQLEKIWEEHRGTLNGMVLQKSKAVIPVGNFDGVIGMSSILLYEAWLTGRPTLSLQPGLRHHALRQIGLRPGAFLIDVRAGAEQKIQDWLNAVKPGLPVQVRDEAKVHAQAPQNVLSLALELAAERQR